MEEVRHLGFVREVLVDEVEGLTIYTVYEGALAAVAGEIFGAEAQVRREFPHRRTDFHLLHADMVQRASLPESVDQVFSRP